MYCKELIISKVTPVKFANYKNKHQIEREKRLKYLIDKLTFDKVIEVVNKYFGINEEQILSKSRKRDLVEARQFTQYYLHKVLNYTCVKVGKITGNRDHATVLHACDATKDLMRYESYNKIAGPALEELNDYFNIDEKM